MTAYHKICPLPVNVNTAAAGSTGGQGPCRVGARMEWLAVRDGTGGCGYTTNIRGGPSEGTQPSPWRSLRRCRDGTCAVAAVVRSPTS